MIFDQAGSDVIAKLILPDMPYEIIPARGEFFYFSPQILYYRFLDIISRINIREMRVERSAYGSYFLSLIKYMRPRVVITFVDNSPDFGELSKKYRDAEFIAVQNGIRFKLTLWDLVPEINGKKSQYIFSHFICFGQNDIDEHEKYGHIVHHAYPAGSLLAGYYRERFAIKDVTSTYDICLISQYRESVIEGTFAPCFKEGNEILWDFLNRYIRTNKYRVCIAMSYDSQEKQRQYFQNIFGDHVTIIESDRLTLESFTSYKAVDESTVSINMDSTLGIEALGFGKKVLFCSFTGESGRYVNCPEICSVPKVDYELFSEKLTYLLNLDQELFEEKTESERKYLMNYNKELPAHRLVRQLIVKMLSDPLSPSKR